MKIIYQMIRTFGSLRKVRSSELNSPNWGGKRISHISAHAVEHINTALKLCVYFVCQVFSTISTLPSTPYYTPWCQKDSGVGFLIWKETYSRKYKSLTLQSQLKGQGNIILILAKEGSFFCIIIDLSRWWYKQEMGWTDDSIKVWYIKTNWSIAAIFFSVDNLHIPSVVTTPASEGEQQDFGLR